MPLDARESMDGLIVHVSTGVRVVSTAATRWALGVAVLGIVVGLAGMIVGRSEALAVVGLLVAVAWVLGVIALVKGLRVGTPVRFGPGGIVVGHDGDPDRRHIPWTGIASAVADLSEIHLLDADGALVTSIACGLHPEHELEWLASEVTSLAERYGRRDEGRVDPRIDWIRAHVAPVEG